MVKTKNRFYDMRAVLAQLGFDVIKFERSADDIGESKVYLSKQLRAGTRDRPPQPAHGRPRRRLSHADRRSRGATGWAAGIPSQMSRSLQTLLLPDAEPSRLNYAVLLQKCTSHPRPGSGTSRAV